MLYDPKIYIRDYGAPTERMLAYWGGFYLTGIDVALKRDLIMHAENPVVGEEFFLLSGDMNSGGDTLDLSGQGNDRLVISDNVAIRVFGPDVTLIYSIIEPVTTGEYSLTGNDAGATRDLFARTESEPFDLTGIDAALKRDLIVHVTAGEFDLVGQDIGVNLGIIFAVEPGVFALDGYDVNLPRQYPIIASAGTISINGVSVGLYADRVIAVAAATFTVMGNAADIITNVPIGLSGDMTDGDDNLLLTGDMQSGTDFLTTSKDGE